MIVTIKYFGMIAETTSMNEELLNFDGGSVGEVKKLLERSYPGLKEHTYRIAVNGNIVTEEQPVPEAAELALLPPFAGG